MTLQIHNLEHFRKVVQFARRKDALPALLESGNFWSINT